MKVASSAFPAGEVIPSKYTCEGADMSPPLQWSGVPAGAKSLALICDDPDAPVGTWVHWVLYDLPITATDLAENGLPRTRCPSAPNKGLTISNVSVTAGHVRHRENRTVYYFKLYALDANLVLNPRATKRELLRSMDGHILAEAQLMGTYERKKFR